MPEKNSLNDFDYFITKVIITIILLFLIYLQEIRLWQDGIKNLDKAKRRHVSKAYSSKVGIKMRK